MKGEGEEAALSTPITPGPASPSSITSAAIRITFNEVERLGI
jgi:hypothetical protein